MGGIHATRIMAAPCSIGSEGIEDQVIEDQSTADKGLMIH